jgi:uncharacterized protein YlxP (DUF503 family)
VVVSCLRFIIELPEAVSLKDKRQVVQSVKHKLQHKYRISVAEVDLQDSLGFAEIGAAVVSNSKRHGEMVLHKALGYVEDMVPGRIRDMQIFSEHY